jgi:hypothetical protein
MKLFRSLAILFAVTGFVGAACAQNSQSKFAGEIRAYNFAYGNNGTLVPALQVDSPNTPTPALATSTISVAYGTVTLGDGTVIAPLSISAPITIGSGANQETVTPSAVSCTTPQIYQSCTFTAYFTYSHGTGDRVISGTYGLQEALNYANSYGVGGIVAVDSQWYALGGTQAIVAASVPYSNVYVLDNSGAPGLRYFVPTATSQATTAAAAASTGSLTAGGALTAGAYFFKTAYVDLQGQVSQASSEVASSLTATSTNASITVNAPAAAAGQVGYIVYMTVHGGGTGNEYYVPLTSTNCTLTKLESVIPACALTNTTYGQTSSAALVAANPVNTSALVIGATDTVNRTAFVYAPSESFGAVGPVPVTILEQPTATSTAAATYHIAAITINAPLFAQVGREYRVCGSGHFTYATTGTQLQFALLEGQYNNSDVALATTTAATSTATSGNAVAQFCFTVDITAVGATTASAWTHAYDIVNTGAASAAATVWTDTNVAVVSTLPDTGVQWLDLEVINAAAFASGGFQLDSLSILPIH